MKDNVNSKLSSILFVSADPYANDLDWKLPIIIEYKKLNYNVNVLMLYRSKKESKNFYIWILEKHSVKVLYKEDLWFLEPIPRVMFKVLTNSESSLIKIISKIYFTDRKSIPIRYLRKLFISKKIKDYLEDCKLVFLCQFPNIHKILILSLFQTLTPKSKAKLISVPDCVRVNWTESRICEYDLLLLNNEKEAEQFKTISDTPFLVTGCQHFKSKWQKEIIKYYKEFNKNEISIPGDKKIILILLVKPVELYFKGISHDEVVSKLCRSLSTPDSYLLIKPHPRANIEELQTLLADILLDNYQIVMDNVYYWANKADKVVSLLSYSCLSALAVKKLPYVYWPITPDYEHFLDVGGDPGLVKLFLQKDSSGRYHSLFNNYAVEVFQEFFEFPEMDVKGTERKLDNFSNDFKLSNYTAKEIIDDINKWFQYNEKNV